jgi:hypothetical protein
MMSGAQLFSPLAPNFYFKREVEKEEDVGKRRRRS